MKVWRAYASLTMFGVVGVATLIAAPAWACSQSPVITTSARSALPGTEIPVKGDQWDLPTKGGPVELRWNSKVGTPVASAAGVSFLVQVPIPVDAPGGFYLVNAQQRSLANNTLTWQRSLVIKVDVPADRATPTTPVVTDPVVTDPVVTDPVVSDPVVTDPVVSDPVVTDPVLASPVVVGGPVIGVPAAPNPAAANPVTGGLGTSGPGGPGPGGQSIGSGGSPRGGSGSLLGGLASGVSQGGLPASGVGTALAVDDRAAADGRRSADQAVGAEAGDLGPLNPAETWSEPVAAEPAPSLFEPVESDERHRSNSGLLGGGLVGLGLMGILGIGVVAGQRRLSLIRTGSGPR